MRWLNGAFFLAFVASLLVQHNDPDPLPWMAVYGAAAVTCVVWDRRRSARWAPGLLAGLALLWSLWILREVPGNVDLGQALGHWEMKGPGSEQVREVGGLVLVGVWMGVLLWRWPRRLPAPPGA